MYNRNDSVIVTYAQFDMGMKYKVYVNRNGYFEYTYAENSLVKAINYADKIYINWTKQRTGGRTMTQINNVLFDNDVAEQIENIISYTEPSELLYVPFYNGMFN